MQDLITELVSLLFPAVNKCPFCSQPAGIDTLCKNCENNFRLYFKKEFCRKCGKILETEGKFGKKLYCYNCRKVDYPFKCARAVGPYEGIMKEAVHRLKYLGERSLAPVMGSLMTEVILKDKRFHGVDLIIPVPLTDKKIKTRRFNQSELLAGQLANLLGIPLIKELQRVKDTPSQAKLTRQSRLVNPEGTFKAEGKISLADKKILLVDDIFTTGSTVREASKTLLEAGGEEIYVITWATGREILKGD